MEYGDLNSQNLCQGIRQGFRQGDKDQTKSNNLQKRHIRKKYRFHYVMKVNSFLKILVS